MNTLTLEKIQVKCNQSGKIYKASVKDLSLEDGQAISEEHLEKGTEVLYEYNKRSYPVTVIKVTSEDGQDGSKRRKIDVKVSADKEADDQGNYIHTYIVQ